MNIEASSRTMRFRATSLLCAVLVGLSGPGPAPARGAAPLATPVIDPLPSTPTLAQGTELKDLRPKPTAGRQEVVASARILPALEPNTATAGASFLWLTVGSATREQVFDAMGVPDAGSEQEPVWTHTPLLRYHGVRRMMARFDGGGVLNQLLIDLAAPVPLTDLANVLALGERTETRAPTDGRGELHVHRTSAAVLRVEAGSVRSIWLLPDRRPTAGPYLPDVERAAVPLPLPPPEARLIEAARTGDLEWVQRLLALGIPSFARDSFGRTAAHHAAMFGHDDVLRALIRTLEPPMPSVVPSTVGDPVFGHGWEESGPWRAWFDDVLFRLESVNAADEQGLTALHLAAREGHAPAAQVLLDAGADPTIAAGDGSTPLHHAARAGAGAVVELLLARGAHVDDRDTLGRTPREVAANEQLSRHLEALESALKQEADYREAEQTLARFLDAIRRGDAKRLQAMMIEPVSEQDDQPLDPVALDYRIERMQVRHGIAHAQGMIKLPGLAYEDRNQEFSIALIQGSEGWLVATFRMTPTGE